MQTPRPRLAKIISKLYATVETRLDDASRGRHYVFGKSETVRRDFTPEQRLEEMKTALYQLGRVEQDLRREIARYGELVKIWKRDTP